MIPIHEAYSVSGPVLSKIIMKSYIITGNDYLSKIGTKHAALSCNPELFLLNLGDAEMLTEKDISLAEHYLVKVWAGVRSSTKAKTFDQLRLEHYVNSSGIDTLPPTSSVIRAHIHRSAYLIKETSSFLDPHYHKADPLENGWISQFGKLIPAKNLKPLPDDILKTCSCQKTCEKKICQCKSNGKKCVVYCHGKMTSQLCKNLK